MTKHNEQAISNTEQLNILADAISDIGYWSWWTEQLPDVFQIEFGGTQLYFPPLSPDQPPQTQIALQFNHPASVNFINRNNNRNEFEWVRLLQEDKTNPPGCSHGEYSFGYSDSTITLLQQSTDCKIIHGTRLTIDDFTIAPISLIFWCGDIGLAITAKELKLLNHTGEISLSDISLINKSWWEYWKHYWGKRGSTAALPKDYACEVTIPLNS